MIDYDKLKKTFDQRTALSKTLIDEFLVHYGVEKDNLARQFDQQVAPYKHLTQKDAAWTRMIKTQYIVHCIFKDGGLLDKYLKRPEIKSRTKEEQQFLKDQLVIPWRFCFSKIIDNPSPDFYTMEDVLTGATFLLYSKSTTLTLTEQSAMLWFNLIAFNGACWETYGPINAYQSFDADDIFFFATQLNEEIQSNEGLSRDLESDPVPYMMLVHGGQMPSTIRDDDEVLIIFSAEEQDSIDVESMSKNFKVEYHENVFRITAKDSIMEPHLATAYFDENEGMVLVTALNDRGYAFFASMLNEHGFNISLEAHVRIHPAMFFTTELVLSRDLSLNPYEHLFEQESTEEEKDELDRLNNLMQAIIPMINAGEEINIEAMATKAGVNVALATEMIENIVGKSRPNKKRK